MEPDGPVDTWGAVVREGRLDLGLGVTAIAGAALWYAVRRRIRAVRVKSARSRRTVPVIEPTEGTEP
jgi:hypothetical protein